MRDRIGQAGISGLKLKSQTGDAARPKIVNQESRSYFCESPIAIQSCWNHSNVPEQASIPEVPNTTVDHSLFELFCLSSGGFASPQPDRFVFPAKCSGACCSVWGDPCWAVVCGHRCGCLTTTECPVSIRVAHDPGEIQTARRVTLWNDHNLFLRVHA